jgi:hypothetical protein
MSNANDDKVSPEVRAQALKMTYAQIKTLLAMEISGECPRTFRATFGALKALGLSGPNGRVSEDGLRMLRALRTFRPYEMNLLEAETRVQMLGLNGSMRSALLLYRDAIGPVTGRPNLDRIHANVNAATRQSLVNRGLLAFGPAGLLTPVGNKVSNWLFLEEARRVHPQWDLSDDFARAAMDLNTVEASPRINPQSVSDAAGISQRNARMRKRLENLIRDGLTFSDCVAAFGVKRDSDVFARRAYEQHHREGEIEIDDVTVISGCDNPEGDYVMAWVWADTSAS